MGKQPERMTRRLQYFWRTTVTAKHGPDGLAEIAALKQSSAIQRFLPHHKLHPESIVKFHLGALGP